MQTQGVCPTCGGEGKTITAKCDKCSGEGVVRGEILTQECGDGGFGYDPLFAPEGHSESFAEMSADEKNAISHRGRAVRKLAEFLNNK